MDLALDLRDDIIKKLCEGQTQQRDKLLWDLLCWYFGTTRIDLDSIAPRLRHTIHSGGAGQRREVYEVDHVPLVEFYNDLETVVMFGNSVKVVNKYKILMDTEM